MKKFPLLISLFLLFLFLAPVLVNAQGLVPCGNPGQDACTIEAFFVMIDRIFNFIVYFIATPIAVLMLTIGGIMIVISGGVGPVTGGNATLLSRGKKIIYMAIIGLVLVFCSWLIVNFILTTLGYKGAWNTL